MYIKITLHSCFDEDDDDNLSEEFLRLEEYEQLLNGYLSSIDLLKS